ncbi:MAG: ribonuclease Z [Chitinophagales bacterium]
MQFEVTILGSNGAVPAFDRHPTSQFINYNGHGYLVDCGEGTQLQMARYAIRRGKLDHIFISHLHGDHFFGLLGLLTSFNLNHRETPLHIYGHPGIEEIVTTQFRHSETTLRFPVHYHVVFANHPELIYEDHQMTVTTIPLKHRIPTTGFLFREKEGLRKMRVEKLAEYKIPVHLISGIKAGSPLVLEDGSVISNEELTLPPAAPRSYAFCSDTAYTDSFTDQIQGVNLLYHEATFLNEHEQRATETMHSTARQAALVAQAANVDQLLLGHFSARYERLERLLEEARVIFQNTSLALEGTVFQI